jgi:hypothetical protein
VMVGVGSDLGLLLLDDLDAAHARLHLHLVPLPLLPKTQL